MNARAKEGLSPAILKVCKSGDELMLTWAKVKEKHKEARVNNTFIISSKVYLI